jgi:hypothetical protein
MRKLLVSVFGAMLAIGAIPVIVFLSAPAQAGGICDNPMLSPAQRAYCNAASGGTGANHCSAWYCGGNPGAGPANPANVCKLTGTC